LVECWLPYGKTEVHLSINLKDLIGVAEPPERQHAQDPRSAVLQSLENPIGGKRLGEVAKPGDSAAIAIDGTMSPDLVRTVVPAIIEHLGATGIPTENVAILVGNGDRERGSQGLLDALQGEFAEKGIEFVNHSRATKDLADVGATAGKTRVEVNTHFTSARVRIAVGEVLPDAYTGFRGAHSAILPGLSSRVAIEMSRNRAFEDVAPGVIDGNPVLNDAFEAARLVGVDMAVNVVATPKGRLVKAYSGELEASWRQAVSEFGDSFKVKVEPNADAIVVSAGGERFDFDLYHAVWALRGIAPIAKKGAPVILLAECSEGLGADGLAKLAHIDMLGELKRRYMLGADAVHLIRSTLRTNEVVLVSALPGRLTEPLGLSAAKTANEALGTATEHRRGRSTLVVTHGCSTILSAS
jgi:nickel-dependent lactate racemase